MCEYNLITRCWNDIEFKLNNVMLWDLNVVAFTHVARKPIVSSHTIDGLPKIKKRLSSMSVDFAICSLGK